MEYKRIVNFNSDQPYYLNEDRLSVLVSILKYWIKDNSKRTVVLGIEEFVKKLENGWVDSRTDFLKVRVPYYVSSAVFIDTDWLVY